MSSKGFQVSVIRRMLERMGIESDLVDLEALVDSELSLEENARIIKREYGVLGEREEKKRVSEKKLDNFLRAVELFEKESERRKMMDSRRQARHTFERSELSDKNFDKWKKSPNKFDISGVDSRFRSD